MKCSASRSGAAGADRRPLPREARAQHGIGRRLIDVPSSSTMCDPLRLVSIATAVPDTRWTRTRGAPDRIVVVSNSPEILAVATARHEFASADRRARRAGPVAASARSESDRPRTRSSALPGRSGDAADASPRRPRRTQRAARVRSSKSRSAPSPLPAARCTVNSTPAAFHAADDTDPQTPSVHWTADLPRSPSARSQRSFHAKRISRATGVLHRRNGSGAGATALLSMLLRIGPQHYSVLNLYERESADLSLLA